ncbi:MAG: transcription-repair coupling factor [Clostridia bacterium]|nr:transcription-repair coupling factor [Clostridia bacterium]
MSCFSKIIEKDEEYVLLSNAIKKGRLPLGALGLPNIGKAFICHTLSKTEKKKIVAIMPDEATATKMVSDLQTLGSRTVKISARDFSFVSTQTTSKEYEHIRLNALSKIATGEYDIAVCSVEGFLQNTLPCEELKKRSLTLSSGDEIALEKVVDILIKAGYVRSSQVDGAGQFSVRGGILDVYPPCCDNPVRIEFWGDTVDTISYFETESQRRTDVTKNITIIPAREVVFDSNEKAVRILEEFVGNIKGKGSVKAKENINNDIERLKAGIRLDSCDKYLPVAYSSVGKVSDYFEKENSLLVVCESVNVKTRAESLLKLFNSEYKSMLEEATLCKGLENYMITQDELIENYKSFGAIYMDNLPRGSFDTSVKELINFSCVQTTLWNGTASVLLDDLAPFKKKKDRLTVVMSGTDKAAKALSGDLFKERYNSVYFEKEVENLPVGSVCVIPGGLSAGVEFPHLKFTVISYGNRQGKKKIHKNSAYKMSNSFHSLEEMNKGDYVVHVNHGIGIYEGITQLSAGGAIKDYIKIRYAKDDILYVPVVQLDLIAKYIGPRSETSRVRLNSLGSDKWLKTKKKVRSAVKDMSEELVELYSKRLKIQGHAFSADIDMQSDFERRFEFDETEDQLRCIDEIKKDMEKPYPMDRLLCGDVGFGKTEVALRGVFKCVADSKQCAILVPTTILALQHYQTITKRFEGFPVEIRMLSRFTSAKEQKEIIQGLKRGSVDIVVGTHKLFSKNIEFRDIGLVIVDEEQRFGVGQKEALKERFSNVDVLTLSATPIPRTLNMAMTGIRDMSIIEEAPMDRYPVQTYILEQNMDVLAQAMEKELRRGGQVYYLYNNVDSIDRKANEIKQYLPDARIVVGHGKMSEEELSDVWKGLIDGEIDILVCTTIIETGVDVPNVNTLIIENADRMGLSQLHQIRGRVGRSSRRASAYFTFTRGKQISEIAERRLSAIKEFTEFGSGFKIAMRDLELRGAGNILGAQQHGHMEAVGYDMYLKILSDAVSEEKGDKKSEEKECLIDLNIDANIPEKYIQSVPNRLAMYRRIADIRTQEDADDVVDELIDRFGDPPSSVMGLVNISLLRNSASDNGIYEIGQEKDRVVFYSDVLDMKKLSAISNAVKGRLTVSTTGRTNFKVKIIKGQSQIDTIKQILALMNIANNKNDDKKTIQNS